MNNEIKISIENETKTLEILTGNALVKKEPENVCIHGLIGSPLDYLRCRVKEIDLLKSHLRVDREKMEIWLQIDEHNAYHDDIIGKLSIDPDFKNFGINTGLSRTTFELANFIKMNRSFFESKTDAMKLVTELKNFRAKVDKDLELSNDDRGNRKVKIFQAVESNIPEEFNLNIKIFKGGETFKFPVEINIDADDFGCSLISPTAKDLLVSCKDDIINEQVKEIKNICSELLIIEI